MVPTWVKLLLTLGATLVTVTLAYAQLKEEDTKIRGDIKLLEREDEVHRDDVEEIKQMLRDEFNRHHPRR
jgi:chaperonin cofactor prefoldin